MKTMRDKITAWLLFAVLVEGLIFLTILIGITTYRLFAGL